MAVSQDTLTTGSVRSQEGAHEYMKQIRSHLLAVGMTEVEVEGAYDASETGSYEQIPPEQDVKRGNTPWSPYLHFEFNDARASESPIVVSFMVGYGAFFDDEADYVDGEYFYEKTNYAIRVRISQGIDEEGEPIGATLNTNNTGAKDDSGNHDYYSMSDKTGDGTFVRYTGDSLTLFLRHNGTYTRYAGARGVIQLHLERLTGNDFVVLPLTAGEGEVTQKVYYSSGASIHSQTQLQARAAGTANLFDKGVAVIAPIYAPVSDGGLLPLKRVFTSPDEVGGSADIVTLDFSGEEKPYLVIKENAMKPYHAGTAWLYEWE